MEQDYEVTISRTEIITFRLKATSPEDAEERYLMDGEEVRSKTSGTTIESVELVTG